MTGPQLREPREPPPCSLAPGLVVAAMALGAAFAFVLALVSAGRF